MLSPGGRLFVESIVTAWREREITAHLQELAELRDQPGTPGDRLTAVFGAYAFIQQRRHGHHAEIAAVLHQGSHVAHAERQALRFFSELVAEGAEAGEVRDDVSPDEPAAYRLHALAAAGALPSRSDDRCNFSRRHGGRLQLLGLRAQDPSSGAFGAWRQVRHDQAAAARRLERARRMPKAPGTRSASTGRPRAGSNPAGPAGWTEPISGRMSLCNSTDPGTPGGTGPRVSTRSVRL
ncbi:hypothetical protein ACIQ6K_34800 [Streptomyces sp. NPDC096354]|uniref:hypothetical protein n=1 Tax=Streptomyces sp. NPDC096354 TaxID=3366088 RepID=UPI003810B891